MIQFLIAYAGLFGKLGFTLIDWFGGSAQQKAEATKAYRAAYEKHKNDGVTSAQLREDYQGQIDELKNGPTDKPQS